MTFLPSSKGKSKMSQNFELHHSLFTDGTLSPCSRPSKAFANASVKLFKWIAQRSNLSTDLVVRHALCTPKLLPARLTGFSDGLPRGQTLLGWPHQRCFLCPSLVLRPQCLGLVVFTRFPQCASCGQFLVCGECVQWLWRQSPARIRSHE